MNRVGNWKTTVTIHDKDRRELWEEVFPGAVVPIISPIPQNVRVPEKGEALAYMLDLEALTRAQLQGVIAVLSKRFGVSLDDVRREITQGVPILCEDVSMNSTDQGLLFSMVEDDLEGFYDEEDGL